MPTVQSRTASGRPMTSTGRTSVRERTTASRPPPPTQGAGCQREDRSEHAAALPKALPQLGATMHDTGTIRPAGEGLRDRSSRSERYRSCRRGSSLKCISSSNVSLRSSSPSSRTPESSKTEPRLPRKAVTTLFPGGAQRVKREDWRGWRGRRPDRYGFVDNRSRHHGGPLQVTKPAPGPNGISSRV